jgi:tetratricopeptide (TPR) repeat protein
MTLGLPFGPKNVQSAIRIASEARDLECTARQDQRFAQKVLAYVYLRVDRKQDAIREFCKAFAYDEASKDLSFATGTTGVDAFEFAILLAGNGRREEAIEMYNAGMRSMQSRTGAFQEPIPFVVTFDVDPEGETWEYSPLRLTAAATMAIATRGGSFDVGDGPVSESDLLKRVRTLLPDWFYPVLAEAPWDMKQVELADRLVQPGLSGG